MLRDTDLMIYAFIIAAIIAAFGWGLFLAALGVIREQSAEIEATKDMRFTREL